MQNPGFSFVLSLFAVFDSLQPRHDLPERLGNSKSLESLVSVTLLGILPLFLLRVLRCPVVKFF